MAERSAQGALAPVPRFWFAVGAGAAAEAAPDVTPEAAGTTSIAGLVAIGPEAALPGTVSGVEFMPLVFAGVLVGELLRSQPAANNPITRHAATANGIGRTPDRWMKDLVTAIVPLAGATRSG